MEKTTTTRYLVIRVKIEHDEGVPIDDILDAGLDYDLTLTDDSAQIVGTEIVACHNSAEGLL